MEYRKDELNEVLNIFQQESTEIISSMDDKLLLLEKDKKNPELEMQLFRDAHSLKGSARMLGFEDIQNIAHKIEDIISLIKEDKLKVTPKITDTISESLEFILELINKTVEQKEEYKNENTKSYIEKLENITKSVVQGIVKNNFSFEITPEKRDFLSKFEKIENIIIDIIYIVSSARKQNNYTNIIQIEEKINNFLFLTKKMENESFLTIKNNAQSIIENIQKFNAAQNKKLAFLDINDSVVLFIENLIKYIDKEKILRKDYWDIVDKQLNEQNSSFENQENFKNIETGIENLKKTPELDRFDDIINKIPLLELTIEFYPEVTSFIDQLASKTDNIKLKAIFKNIKNIIDIHANKNVLMPKDAANAIKGLLEDIKKEAFSYDEILKRAEAIKILVEFHNKNNIAYDTKHSEIKAQNKQPELSQKDILNTITNTEIKTLRIDSHKLDNLVGQIGELIVSKIKTNEQLSLVKKINIDLLDWQKNFSKMSYFIKYFDKKFLSNPISNNEYSSYDLQKIVAYNKQLCTLSEAHQEKIGLLIKEMSDLFRQLQESEVKLNSTTTEIETMVKNMRILPLSTIFQLFPRMVHNIARDKNKKIDLIIDGADITADKTIIEEIKIPLMHIIRNSIDHGIEDVETRKELGKNPVGKIEIKALYQDNKIIIDIKDDGRGLDIEKIKAKALEKKILTQEEINLINEEELTNLIFYPGFSTEDFVTELSGRGLGLDIVNNKISQLNGRIDIFSQIKKGTIVRIILPAAIATKKVFVIEEQEQLWAIETSVIKTILRIDADEIFEKDNKNYYIYNNNAIEIFTLSQILNLDKASKNTNKYTLMIIGVENTSYGIIVDKLISDQEIVHKKLAPPLYRVKHISGITTLANGEACLILSVEDIISSISTKKLRKMVKISGLSTKTKNNSNYKILIVDDSQTTRILQKNIISNRGYNVTTALDPLDALEKVQQVKFDLIVSDVNMPNMDGFQFISKVRKMPKYKNLPIIVISSEPKEKFTEEIEQTRVLAYIQKNNFKQENLLKYIEDALN